MIEVKKLRIVVHPHEALRKKAEPIDKVTDEVRSVANRMFQLMKQMKGLGLAAPQVGLPWRMFVMDSPQTGPSVYINPKFTSHFGGKEIGPEGCLSIPGVICEVSRSRVISIAGLDQRGNEFLTTATGEVARCWQHEVDHLDGVLIIDKAVGPVRHARHS